VTKDRVYWSGHGDSHADIIHEHMLYSDGVRGANVVGVEIVPPNDDYSLPIEQWRFAIDGGYKGILPEWWDAEDAERLCRDVLPEWYAAHVITGPGGTCRTGDTRIVLGWAVVKVHGGLCYTYAGSIVTTYGGDCHAHNGSLVTMRGGDCSANAGSIVTVYDGDCYACAGSTVTMYGGDCHAHADSTVTIHGGECHARAGSTVTVYEGRCHIYKGANVIDRRKE
jgi:hypothetical protein